MQHPYKKKKTRKLCKVLQNADILVSEQPTNILFVSNSSVMVGVSLECLEELFQEFDPKCIFIVFPTTKSYSFVQFTDVALAMKALMQLNGTKPTNFPPGNPPITLLYVNKVPEQLTLALPRNIPEGLEVLDNFIDEAQERKLIKFLEERYAQCTKLKNRHVLHFGHKFNYDINEASEPADEPIPPILCALNRKIVEALEDSQTEPDQITVNFYEPGQGIPPHFDAHSAFGERIYSLSLLSDIVMEFRDGACPSQQCDVLLPRRSLLALSGESRYRYKHCIMTRKRDVNPENNRVFARRRRISITFRTVNPRGRCQCPFVEFCDWDRDGQMRVPDSDARGKHLEREYVQKVYDRIADHFDQTRHSSWTGVTQFLQTLPSQSLVLDVGCGNGKYLCREDKLIKFGCDLSASLIKIAQSKRCPVFRADALELPVRDGAFDAVISIAVIHHFSTHERRAKAISEILRVLRPGGVACVTAWAFDQTTPDGQTESVYASRMRANKSIAACNDEEEEDANYAEQGNKATFTPPAPESVNANNSKEKRNGQETNEQEKTTATTTTSRLRIHDGKQFAQQDMLVPWISTGNCAESSATSPAAAHADFRYYHLFVRGELAALVRQFENGAAEGGGGGGFESELVSERYDEGNWVVVFRRRKVILDEVKNEAAETEP